MPLVILVCIARGGSMPELKLTQVRGDVCPDGRTCPAVLTSNRETVFVVGKRVTDPAALAQMAIGDDEIAVEVPGSLLPEVAADADH
jgi:sulfur carrier protein ThiS